ncbi:MAG: beta,4-mannooligosaccharide/beta,4-mannosyl-N-acetylglucosamine phosphorylase [Bacillota bacterium]|nr:beta,4-mannooligosaccharide/beta,4-mannosyl-N-acetylglucosamine phosphorylase [Bacillota bacterium]
MEKFVVETENHNFKRFNPRSLLRRYEGNPVLRPEEWPYPVNAVFNPGAVQFDGETLLLVRVEDLRGFSHLTIARSRDGKKGWRIDPEPTLIPDERYQEEQWGLEDPRIVWLEDREEYAITYVSFSKGGPVVSLMTTRDFLSFRRFGALLPPEDKDASLFPCQFNGRYALIHRPIIRGEAHIWLSLSPDLVHWGHHRILIPVRPGWWDCHRVGLGPPPIKTDEGWLVIYHGVRLTASGALYRVGLALLDLDEPWKIINRSDEWVFSPSERYEQVGDVPGVTFPTGAIVDEKINQVRIYYGAADSTVALTIGDLRALLEYVKSSSRVQPAYP